MFFVNCMISHHNARTHFSLVVEIDRIIMRPHTQHVQLKQYFIFSPGVLIGKIFSDRKMRTDFAPICSRRSLRQIDIGATSARERLPSCRCGNLFELVRGL